MPQTISQVEADCFLRNGFMSSAENVTEAALRTLTGWKIFMYTITTDNGREFARHQTISTKLDVDYYFAKPYHSGERGANENINGLLRQYFPKGHEISFKSRKKSLKRLKPNKIIDPGKGMAMDRQTR